MNGLLAAQAILPSLHAAATISAVAEEEPELSWDDISAVLLLLMKIDATLERIERLLTEDDNGEEDPEP